jgi:hypothetical protein
MAMDVHQESPLHSLPNIKARTVSAFNFHPSTITKVKPEEIRILPCKPAQTEQKTVVEKGKLRPPRELTHKKKNQHRCLDPGPQSRPRRSGLCTRVHGMVAQQLLPVALFPSFPFIFSIFSSRSSR